MYVVTLGEVHRDGEVYRVGDSVPAMKGELSPQVAAGVVKWVTPEKPKPVAKTTPTKSVK